MMSQILTVHVGLRVNLVKRHREILTFEFWTFHVQPSADALMSSKPG
jgi:hypothetical protein